jgi:hypothetical protein
MSSSETDPYDIYHPYVHRVVGFYFKHRLIGMPLLFVGVGILMLPATARHKILFRVDNEATRRIARDMPRHVHIEPSRD